MPPCYILPPYLAAYLMLSYFYGCLMMRYVLITLVRESIAYPYMDFQKSMDTHIDIHDFWISPQLSISVWISTLISKPGYPCKDILLWISLNNKDPWMDIHVLWISVFNYPWFYGYPFGYPWISIDIYTLTCNVFTIQGKYVSASAYQR